MTLPYYISWCKQKDASTFEVNSVNGVKLFCTLDENKSHEVIDMSSISYQGHFGHNHPTIISKIKNQLDSIPLASPKATYAGKESATYDLLKYMKKTDGKIFYTTGGSETIENALKIARQITKKKIILARKNSYHGATAGALTATGDWRNPPHQLPNDWVVRIPEPNDIESIEKTREVILQTGPENIAAFILETITGGNGVIIPTKNWWSEIKKLCIEFNILLIMDEVVCGFHRTGSAFGYMNYDVEPDLICMAKGITGGMIPFGALWTSAKIAQYYEEEILSCGLTNYAHPLGMAAMAAVLEIVNNQEFLKNLKNIETVFALELKKLKDLPNISEIRNIGMLAAIDIKQTIQWKDFFKEGIYLVSQNNRIILAPPLIITEQELIWAFAKITKVLKLEGKNE